MASSEQPTATLQPHHPQHLHSINGMPHGLGLLTTVASLPPKYRSRYLNIRTKCEVPLDLSVKSPISPHIVSDVPAAASFAEVYTEEAAAAATAPTILTDASMNKQANQQQTATTTTTATVTITKISKPITPPLTPPIKRSLAAADEVDENLDDGGIVERFIADHYTNPPKMAKTATHATTRRERTPTKAAIKVVEPPQPPKSSKAATATKVAAAKPQNKATRKLKFDEETSSPVSGTIIRPLEDITDGTMQYSNGDIDPKYNIVEVTEETKAELAAIKNVIGDYVCKLCRIKFEDAFELARHRCACIVLLEYRCPECGKQFNCPANLASHRRWHKPKKEQAAGDGSAASRASSKKENQSSPAPAKRKATDQQFAYGCGECGKKFKRQAYLRKHQATHTKGKAAKQPASTESESESDKNDHHPTMANRPMYGTLSHSSLSSSSVQSSSNSSQHSYNGKEEEASAAAEQRSTVHYSMSRHQYDYEADSMSDCSTSSMSYGRLQIVESGLTEEENIAAAALTNLRNCASVIQHTTLAH